MAFRDAQSHPMSGTGRLGPACSPNSYRKCRGTCHARPSLGLSGGVCIPLDSSSPSCDSPNQRQDASERASIELLQCGPYPQTA